MSDAERARQYRIRKREDILQNNQGAILTISPSPVSGAERARQFRTRNRHLKALCNQLDDVENDLVVYDEFMVVENLDEDQINVRSGGVAIYHNNDDIVNIVTPLTEMTIGQSKLYNSKITPVGEFCVAACLRQNEPIIIIVAVCNQIKK
ncbi:unnamed protein product [Macrosiphum euphorbiae]|uniref:Uncharacterized protein n=1 Tax=Macrosiphum euphorbiae TaxID=13131 RepID=A0AAV0WM91_9HEMI|nr:unnamed protein product [Macrosiphum euphorbiae]